jgi:multiple sugar transport system ATP-binding protein
MADIKLKGVSKRFGTVVVLENVSMQINTGEFVVFLGPSGCGKSTLLRMIAGLESVDEGEIYIGDRRVDQLPPNQREVSMVFQNYALYPHMTVRNNMSFGLQNIGTPKDQIDSQIAQAAKILELESLLDRKPAQLSGGQRQRVAIGRAIVRNPKAFLLDEPLSNLDAGLRVRTRVELAQLHQRMKATMVFVTHDQTEAMTLADRIVVMNNRKIEQIGTPMDIYSKPASRFVAAFVGSPAMNFIPVTAVEEADGMAVVTLPNKARVETTIPVASLPGGEMTLGVRPDAVRLGEGTTDLRGIPDVVERLGDRTFAYVKLDQDILLIAEDKGDSVVQVGADLNLTIDGRRTHLFDAEGVAYHAQV